VDKLTLKRKFFHYICICTHTHTYILASPLVALNKTLDTMSRHEGSEESSYLVLNNHMSELELERHVNFNQSNRVC
jgi:hypothetical protein